MSAMPKVFEGTWEEVLRHASTLAGHRLRVTVLDEILNPCNHPAFDTSPIAVDAWIKQFREHIASLPEIHFADDSRDAAYEDRLDHQI